jgi:hypothetical protein
MYRRTFIGGLGLAVLVTLTGCGTGEAPRATTGSSATTTPAVNIAPTQTRAAELTQVVAARPRELSVEQVRSRSSIEHATSHPNVESAA